MVIVIVSVSLLLFLHCVKQIGNTIARPATKQAAGISVHNNILFFLEELETRDFVVLFVFISLVYQKKKKTKVVCIYCIQYKLNIINMFE
ncbi:hypothetical protein FACS189459_0350 [Bacilli bacterium]|nr:hypothetical protein FACS189459_0350 [Bacilli bacterium]